MKKWIYITMISLGIALFLFAALLSYSLSRKTIFFIDVIYSKIALQMAFVSLIGLVIAIIGIFSLKRHKTLPDH